MSQHDFNIANQTFSATRTDLNNAFGALATNSAGNSAPSTTYASQWWFDSDDNQLYIRNKDNDAWVKVVTIGATSDKIDSIADSISIASNGSVSITTSDNTDILSLISTDADSSGGPKMNLYRNSSSPADNDSLGRISFTGRNDNSQDVVIAEWEAVMTDVSDGTEDGQTIFRNMFAGNPKPYMDFSSAGTVFNNDSLDLDFRVESNGNANMLFVNGGNNTVGIGTGSPAQVSGSDTALEISGSTAPALIINDTGQGEKYQLFADSTKFKMQYGTNTPFFTFDASNSNTGIGTASPSSYNSAANDLVIANTGLAGITIASGTSSTGGIFFADGTSGDAQYRGTIQYNQTNDFMVFGTTGGVERMRIHSSGMTELKVPDSANTLQLTPSGTNANGTINFNSPGSGGGVFKVANTERMRINSSGYVGINTNSPSAHLEVHSDNNIAGIETQPKINQLHYAMIFRNSSGNDVGNIAAGSSSTAFNTSSDYRLKENVSYDFDATTRLKQLKPARFNWISDDTNTLIDGFLAHEVSDIVPEAITGEKDATETRIKVVLDSNGNQIAKNVEEADWVIGKSDILWTFDDLETQDVLYTSDDELPDGVEVGDVKQEATQTVGDVKTEAIYPSDSTWVASKVYPKHQKIDQSKLVPLLVKTIQELEARITALES